jgi:hypothetical protein
MSKRELIARELDRLSGADLDCLLAFLRALAEHREEETFSLMAVNQH